MKAKIICLSILAAIALCGCAEPSARKYAIVYGESFTTTAEAVQEVSLAVGNASRFGYRPVSVGGGPGVGGGEGGGKLVNIYILLEGPSSAPDILSATGNPVP